jgi:hypothetical protein
VPKVESCREALDAQAVGNALYGLQGMTSDKAAVQAILLALVPKVECCREALDAQAIGNALYGMQGMSSDCQEVRAMLSALRPKVESCREALDAQAVGNALYGMQGMTSDSAEVRALLLILVPRVESCREALYAQNVGLALYGMQGMREEDISLSILDFLFSKTQAIAGNALLCSSMSCKDLVSFGQHLALVLSQLRFILKNGCEKWEKISILIANELLNRKITMEQHELYGGSNFQSAPEQRVHTLAKMAFDSSFMSVSSNEYLFNLFESDIVLRILINNELPLCQSNNSELIINIEIDGVHHRQEKKKRFCVLRDKYLKSQGVFIERIQASTLRRKKDQEVKEWLQEKVKDAQDSLHHIVDDNSIL